MDKLLLKQLLYYSCYLAFPFIAYLVFRLWRYPKHRWIRIVLLGSALLFVWARFVEPQLIVVHQHRATLGFPAKIAVISDLHMGVYKRTAFLERLVGKLNTLDLDVVLIAGDLIDDPDRSLGELFAPFGKLRHKAYAVRGNHDTQRRIGASVEELRKVLAASSVTLLENETAQLGRFVLVGLGDSWSGNDRVQMLAPFHESENVIVVTHNPETALRLPLARADVTLAGHTHGGQIRIPWLYRFVIPAQAPFDRGWYDLPATRLFITSGVGEQGLPLRLLVPPVIDVIVLD